MTLNKNIIVVFLTLFYFGSLFAQNSNDHFEVPARIQLASEKLQF